MSRPSSLRLIAVTSGDPCGIGPEVIIKSLSRLRIPSSIRILVIGDQTVFRQTAQRLGKKILPWPLARQGQPFSPGVSFYDLKHPHRFLPGGSSAQAGKASLDYLNAALDLWRKDQLYGLVTGPITKWAVQKVNRSFAGHTEYLAYYTKTKKVVMLFASNAFRVVVITRHIPLRAVSQALTPALLSSTIRLTHQALRRQFGVKNPRLALCGLNPHAAELARQSSEEKRVMLPVLRALLKSGIRCEGPFAADGFFAEAYKHYDAVFCPYHDQGLIPFKMAARDSGCQASLGLPFIRTSPDHGSGLDIAGKAKAHPGSMGYALRLAIDGVLRQMR